MEPVAVPIAPLDEEVAAAISSGDPASVWSVTAALASLDQEDYQLHRLAIKNAFGRSVSLAALDKAIAAKRGEKSSAPSQSHQGPEANDVANRILAQHDIVNVADTAYRYDGTKWETIRVTSLQQLALIADGEKLSTRNRRVEIADFIRAKTFRPKLAWRSIEMHEIPVANGVVDLRDLSVRPHRKEDYLQTCIPWKFNLHAQCPELMRCMDTYFGADDDGDLKIASLQEFFGYCLMPHARYKKALFCLGESDCGKSTVPFLLRKLLGQENVTAVGVQDMDDSRKRAPLLSKLVNLLTELTSDALIADGGFKTLVSTEEPILFDPKWGEPIMDVPICKHVVVTNTLPKINDRSNATFRRLLLIHFNHVIPSDKQDTRVWDRLAGEVEGILNWAIEGAQRLYQNGGVFSDAGRAEVAEYRAEQNPLLKFIEDCCELDPDYKTGEPSSYMTITTQFVERFRSYHGGRWAPQQIFSMLRTAGFHTSKHQIHVAGSKYRCVFGLRLNGSIYNGQG